ncbi:uncharacterized protein FTOL_05038 [Fusarium torulosum]|uniref:Uncharacterized protein n=1 Tax=Fusarium torulosum TaxID=33205 RepID=A0AAE8M6V3_9HYPO|nr:uncharacterized protein FTOL_05038 [Fusarium torulosum]
MTDIKNGVDHNFGLKTSHCAPAVEVETRIRSNDKPSPLSLEVSLLSIPYTTLTTWTSRVMQ